LAQFFHLSSDNYDLAVDLFVFLLYNREYPGAPDRGGKKEDTKNYVELVKTLRDTFDKTGRSLGITFTAPSSYWYLKWFDLPGMMKYCDWVNLVCLTFFLLVFLFLQTEVLSLT